MRGPLIALVCTGASLLVSSAAFAQDPYLDFRVPEARSFSWTVSGYTQASLSDANVLGTNSHNSNRWGAFGTTAHHRAESEQRVWDLRADLAGQWNLSSRSNWLGSVYRSRDLSVFDNYFASIRASTTRFLGASDWGIDVDAGASYTSSRSGSSDDVTTFGTPTQSRNSTDASTHSYAGFVDEFMGPGYGRVRDVTGVFDAQVLERRLDSTGRLRHALSPDARRRLAELFSVRTSLGEAHDRPSRYFWREVERVLKADDALAEGWFDAQSLLRALESSTLAIPLVRLAGWRVSAGYFVELRRGHEDSERRDESVNITGGVPTTIFFFETGSRSTLDRDRELARLNLAYHRPVGMRWQMGLASSAAYGDGASRLALLESSAELDHVIADRWVLSATAAQQVESVQDDGVRTHPTWRAQGGLQLAYFMEDSWTLFARDQLFQERQHVSFVSFGVPIVASEFRRTNQLSIGLTYRPAGRFEAPGLGISERLTRVPL